MHGQVVRKLNKEFSNIYHYHLSSISKMVLRRIEGRGTGSFLEGIAPIPPPTPRVSQWVSLSPQPTPAAASPVPWQQTPLFPTYSSTYLSLTRKDTIVIVIIIVYNSPSHLLSPHIVIHTSRPAANEHITTTTFCGLWFFSTRGKQATFEDALPRCHFRLYSIFSIHAPPPPPSPASKVLTKLILLMWDYWSWWRSF